jgi:hypothetical protein
MNKHPEAHCQRRGFENDMSGIDRKQKGKERLDRVLLVVGDLIHLRARFQMGA